uniref:Uncharacterized protein n=1 Tax=Ovis aries TaxID=9940 RepID=A0AC11ELE4_SHEEP
MEGPTPGTEDRLRGTEVQTWAEAQRDSYTHHIRWPKYWSFSFNIRPSNEHPGLISFRMDWLDLLAVQGTLKTLLQHHSSKASILQRPAFFIVQLSHPYMTTGRTIALTRWTLVDKGEVFGSSWLNNFQSPNQFC